MTEQLMQLMGRAGFNSVFIGIETPDEESLNECNKVQNKNRDLVASVKKIQNHGFEVQGGFIVGFDSDPISIFRSHIKIIQKSGIVTAMVSLLNASRGTRLYHRLEKRKTVYYAWVPVTILTPQLTSSLKWITRHLLMATKVFWTEFIRRSSITNGSKHS